MTFAQNETLKRIQTLDRIPTLPQVMTHMLEVLEDNTSCVDDVTAILAADPIITARILRLANSAFFGSRFQIDSIHRAVVTVGFEAVKQLTLATTVLDSMASKSQPALDPEDFWMHALGSAKAAQLLAFSTRQISMPEACFTGGLLHDLGKFVLSLSLQEEYCAVLQTATEEDTPIALIEQRMLQTDHGEVGGWLCHRWSFPEVIATTVQNANHPERHEGIYQKEVLIVSLASDMARIADFGHGGDTTDISLNERRVSALGLQMAQVTEICDALVLMKEDGQRLLGMLRDG